MFRKLNARCFAAAMAIGLGLGAAGAALPVSAEQSDAVVMAKFAPVSAASALNRVASASGAEIVLARPQSHKIQFLRGGAARVAIWDGARYLPHVFTSIESRDGSRICLARTRGWTGGCLTIKSNGHDFRCRYLWNNGSSGETACRLTPIGRS